MSENQKLPESVLTDKIECTENNIIGKIGVKIPFQSIPYNKDIKDVANTLSDFIEQYFSEPHEVRDVSPRFGALEPHFLVQTIREEKTLAIVNYHVISNRRTNDNDLFVKGEHYVLVYMDGICKHDESVLEAYAQYLQE